jgi:omega-amidase
MKPTLSIALIQSDIIWENPQENRTYLDKKFLELKNDVDLIVLPEMFTTGFTMNAPKIAETMKGETIAWMQKTAQKKKAAITGSIVIEENHVYYNRLLFVHPSGKMEWYDKKHTFTLVGEDKIYKSGNKKQIVAYDGWAICLLVCYDLRFPVWSRNTENYDALLYVANWPKPRITAWDTLLKARAVENMCYGIGVNRVGFDANGNEYPGHSAVYDTLGNQLVFSDKEEILYVELHKTHIEETRKKLRFLEDRDQFIVV